MRTVTPLYVLWQRGGILLLWMGGIFLLSSFPGSGQPYDPPLWYFVERKGAHIVEYAFLALLAVRFFVVQYPRERLRNVLLLAGTFALAYAATDELHQFLVPYRGARLSDVAIDGIGILLMIGMLWKIRPVRLVDGREAMVVSQKNDRSGRRRPLSGKQKRVRQVS